MMADADGHLVDFLPIGSQGVEALFAFEEAMGGGGSEGDDDLGTHDFDLGENKGAGELDFFGTRGTVIARLTGKGGTKFTDVGEVDLFARETHSLEDGFKLVAGGSGKRFTLLFVLKAGGIADEHELGSGRALGKDEGLAEGAQVAQGGPVLGEVAQVGELFGGGVAVGDGLGDVERFFLAVLAGGGAGDHGALLGEGGGGVASRSFGGGLFSEGDFSFVDFAQNFAGLGGDREVGLALG